MRFGQLAALCRLAAGTLGPVALAGCGIGSTAATALSPAPLPAYGIGDSYQFSDGTTETVVATEHDDVRWRGTDGSYVTSRDVLLPRLSWNGATERGQRRIPEATARLFPLQGGKTVSFDATSVVRSASGRQITTREAWRCTVAGTVPVTTPAGRFTTWRVDCAMSGQPGGSFQRSLYYAPAVGFYVRREERTGDGPVRVAELSDYASAEPALPASALRLRVNGIQQALERELSGRPAVWRDGWTGNAGEVMPVRTVRSAHYGWCRDFAEQIRTPGRLYNLQGTGCRNASGIWDIISLEPSKGS